MLMQSYNHFILQKAFVPGRDHVNVVEKLSKKIVGTKSPWTVSHSYFVPSVVELICHFCKALFSS